MFEVQQTSVYRTWFASLRDGVARSRIDIRIGRLEIGNFGDAKPVGGGVHELRMTFGPGYRVYFTRRGKRLILLLCGGDKGSQERDIARAKELVAQLE